MLNLMDNHPIPQDVTGFQFKLIGNMTVKQFAYLATGVVFAWILFQLPINILIKFPLCAFSASLGIGLAYFPVSGRPMDVMIGNYIKALFRPTQFVYEKTGGQIYFPNKTPVATTIKNIGQYKNDLSPFPKDQLKAYLVTLNAKPRNKADEIENNFLMSVSGLATSHASQPAPSLTVLQTSPQLNPIRQSDLPKPPSEQKLVVSLPNVNAQATPPLASMLPVKPTIPPHPPLAGQAENIMPLKGFNKSIGTPNVPEFPNLITGITKDARGNALSNILIEIKDSQGNPVRAFKTNELGRFASATPLINGVYGIEFEDPKAQNRFEKLMINVAGQIILPIEAISVDTREELRRSLFNTN
ncbi:MAG: hypothetical protein A3B47_04270 [Candidatus Levybacteria bacterium RIFCSPLOWO2_01_FULL_39_24]|nr:MAG: hypothetical protein A3E12_04070 [Candidatus Levybacteria bacterium RIFCSPHIGHO2_12_FULL_39_9]OGH45882.1 MAG: hypothetical protein A3B47_04270 [Candidatus Levybacteria bacterium RIFCSPLOWO2_01_FULL_39_24]